jgi:hypothetical protein
MQLGRQVSVPPARSFAYQRPAGSHVRLAQRRCSTARSSVSPRRVGGRATLVRVEAASLLPWHTPRLLHHNPDGHGEARSDRQKDRSLTYPWLSSRGTDARLYENGNPVDED